MKWFWQKDKQPAQKKSSDIDALLRNLFEMHKTVAGIQVTPETCMQSPTVQAIVNAVSKRISVSPVHVFAKTFANGRERKERLPNHTVERLLRQPNPWQTRTNYWADATSSLMRYGRFHAFKAQGSTGPIQELIPLRASSVEIVQEDDYRFFYRVNGKDIVQPRKMHYARLAARDFIRGDSPITDVRESIALEIAAERFGAAFFGNGALPLLYFKMMEGFGDFETDEEKTAFLESVKQALGGKNSFSTFMLPQGMDLGTLKVENDKAQFIETRKFMRSVIAGAFGVPPHLVGDLERATFNNVEQQDADFVINVVMPIAQVFEAAMERDLLTEADRRAGTIIRFNLDAVQRADFKSRQEGLKIQRESGVINANDWRERENMNPLSEEDGGEDYIRPLNMSVAGQESDQPETEDENDEETDAPVSD